jgi:hypothetical protein
MYDPRPPLFQRCHLLAVASTGPRDRKFRAGWSSGFDHHSCGNVFKSLGYRLVKAGAGSPKPAQLPAA